MSGKAKAEPSKGAKGDIEMGTADDDEEEFLRNPSIGELTSTTEKRREDFQKRMERVKEQDRIAARLGNEDTNPNASPTRTLTLTLTLALALTLPLPPTRLGNEESTWSQLRRTPLPNGFLKKLQQTADKAAQECTGPTPTPG